MPIIINSRYINGKEKSFCIHERDFTNAIFINENQLFKSSLSETIDNNWEEIKKSSHYSFLEDDEDKKRIKKYLGLSKNQFSNLDTEPGIYQIPIGEKEKFRAFTIFKKSFLYLLFFDPNHHFYPNFNDGKFKFPQKEDKANCLMRKENCRKFYKLESLPEKERIKLIKKLITERNQKRRKR